MRWADFTGYRLSVKVLDYWLFLNQWGVDVYIKLLKYNCSLLYCIVPPAHLHTVVPLGPPFGTFICIIYIISLSDSCGKHHIFHRCLFCLNWPFGRRAQLVHGGDKVLPVHDSCSLAWWKPTLELSYGMKLHSCSFSCSCSPLSSINLMRRCPVPSTAVPLSSPHRTAHTAAFIYLSTSAVVLVAT